jgi:hypothetical protein
MSSGMSAPNNTLELTAQSLRASVPSRCSAAAQRERSAQGATTPMMPNTAPRRTPPERRRSRGNREAWRQDSVPYTPFPRDPLRPGRRIHIGDGGARASHGESRSSDGGTAPSENDGYNHSSTEPLRVVIFYVSDPDTPFLDAIR